MIGAIRKFIRKPGDKINVLTFPTHESYQSNLSNCNANFYLFHSQGIKVWEDKYRPLPENHHRLPPNYLPPDLDFDVVWSQNKFGQFQIAAQIANDLQCPLISLEHTLPMMEWSVAQLEQLKRMSGHINLFISEYSRGQWGWKEDEAEIIHHGINTDTFQNYNLDREPVCLSVVNDWIQRDWCMPVGQRILTEQGYVPIEKVSIGMNALGDGGEFNTVTKVFKRQYNGPMTKFYLDDSKTPLYLTSEHNIRVWRNDQWKYIDSSRLVPGDVLKFPNHVQTDYSLIDKDYAWILGKIIGNGSVGKEGLVEICFNLEQKDQLDRAIPILEKIFPHSVVTTTMKNGIYNLVVSVKTFATWFRERIGTKSNNKSIPSFIMNNSQDIRVAMLQGLWMSDGSFSNGEYSERCVYSTTSIKLASQVSSILHSCGIKAKISKEKRTTNKCKQITWIYRVSGYNKQNVENCKNLIFNSVILEPYQYKVREVTVEEEWVGEVFNCEVANDPSYVLEPGLVVHNCCGYTPWVHLTKDLPIKVLGDTPGLSRPASSLEELVKAYNTSEIFVNTSTVSPVPTALLESMACGCCPITLATCMIPEIITNGVNGFISNDLSELRHYLELCLSNKALCRRIGQAARQTVLDKFSHIDFAKNWDNIFERAANTPFTRLVGI